MNIFISWSGERSHRVALVLKDWFPSVIQAVKPYVSSDDIDKGARWFKDISVELEKSDFGIICITPENQDEPWLAFEAGALSKKLDESRVCPLVIGLVKTDLTGPLAQFQATEAANKEDLLQLIRTINGRLEEKQGLDTMRLDQSFEQWWPVLKKKYEEASQPPKAAAEHQPRPERDILEEILELVRTINRGRPTTPISALFSQAVRRPIIERGSATLLSGGTLTDPTPTLPLGKDTGKKPKPKKPKP